MDKFKVLKVEKATTKAGKSMYKVELEQNGNTLKINLFNKTHAEMLYGSLKEDLEPQVELEQNGEYTNIKDVITLAEPNADIPTAAPYVPKSGGGFGGGKASPEKIASIERQSSLIQAVELVCASKADIKDLIPMANKLYDWLHNEPK